MITIRSKLISWICILFMLMGALIYIPLSNILPQIVISQVLKRDAEIAQYLAEEIESLLLLNDKMTLSILLHDNWKRLEDVHYLYVRSGNGDIASHTFAEGFPKRLLSFNLNSRSPYKIKEFLGENGKIYDIAVPLSDGELGTLHLGVSLESKKDDIAAIWKINHYIAIVILTGLGIGISVFLIIGFLFSNQIIKLKNFASKIGSGDLEAKIDVKSKDEIGTLALAFNEMAHRLKDKIQEIKRLNTIEERNRIALDLHDSCAQDLANIIKRLELCEILFKIKPQEAFEELKTLREGTKDILNRTRKVIFDLKSPEDSDFDLLDKLTNHIRDYQRQNDIDVKLDIIGSTDNIPPDKSKSIFYIIVEALTNIKKHSLANEVEVNLESNRNGNLIINIKDNGKGFDIKNTLLNTPNCGKFGLISMHERASSLGGELAIESQPERGTKVSINIPLVETVD